MKITQFRESSSYPDLLEISHKCMQGTCGSHTKEDTPAAAVGTWPSGIPRDSGKEQDENGVAELVEPVTPPSCFRGACEEQDEILGKVSKMLAVQLHISICTIGCSKPSGKNLGADGLRQLGRLSTVNPMHSVGR